MTLTAVRMYLVCMFLMVAGASLATDDHLLVTEAVVTPTASEYIEIANPAGVPIALDTVYLSDDEDYALLPGSFGDGPAPSIGSSDFIAQFPPGAVIAPGQVMVIAFDGAGFLAAFGFSADFEIKGTDAGTPDMIATSVGGSAGLTNSGENVVLFTWDGVSDLVADIDMVNIGTPSTSNDIATKTGLAVDGPDADTAASTYAADSASMPQQASDPGFGVSTKRVAFEAGNENAGGNGLTGDDETSENISVTWDSAYTAPNPGVSLLFPGTPQVVINEVDADTPGTDTQEFVELYGTPNAALDGLVLVFFNGSNDSSYAAYDLDGYNLNADGFLVLGNAGVANVSIVFGSNGLQNGADAVALFSGDAADFPNGTAVTDTNLIDALVYDTNDSDDTGLLNVLTPGDPQQNEGGAGDKDNHSNSRVPNGAASWLQQAPTPGASNDPVDPATVVINEVDADTAGTDTLEFVELYGDANAALDGLVVVFYNGSNDSAYAAYDLDGYTTNADGFFVLGNAGVANVSLTFGSNGLQNGADAVALYAGNASDFTSGTAVTNANLIDAVVYDTNDSDDAGLLGVLLPGQPQLNEGGGGDKDAHSNSRLPDGGAALDVSTFVQQEATPGVSNVPIPTVFVNEVDADTSGSDMEEFVELFGDPGASLNGLVLVFYNGSSDTAYAAYDLDGYSLNAEGFFVAGNAAVANVALVFNNNGLQNGADAVALYVGNASDFPNGTPVTTSGLIDALVYDTDDSDDAGLLGLLNPGQPQVNERGAGSGTTHANARVPDGGVLRDTNTYIQQDPTPGAPNFVVVPVIPATIAQVQGSGDISPLEAQLVGISGVVVTATTFNGFYVQTPDNQVDADPATSEGLFVFISGGASVVPGDVVDVEGEVVEYFGFTELSGSTTYTVVATGAQLPAAIALDATTPSSSPAALSDLEKYEGMRVAATGALASGPTNRFGNIPVVMTGQRAYREPGIAYPGLPGLPVWDGNPEVFEINPDGAGLANVNVFSGATLDAEGPLGYSFGKYQIQPTSLSHTDAPAPSGVRAKNNGEITVASQNMFRFFNNSSDFADRLVKFSAWTRDVLGAPDILAVQEVDSVEALEALAAQIVTDDPNLIYDAYLVEGNDLGGIDVGFLVRDTIAVNNVIQFEKDAQFTFNDRDYWIHDRPPLLLEAAVLTGGTPVPVEVMVLHNRSLLSLETSEFARTKRLIQAENIAQIIQDRQLANPGVRLVVTGDFNAYEFTDGFVDCTGIIAGNLDPLGALLPGLDLVDPNLTNQVNEVPATERYSFLFEGTAQTLDNMLTSSGLADFVVEMQYGRGNADAPGSLASDTSTPYRSADHDGLVLYLFIDSDGDGIPDSDDTCPASDLSDTVIIDGCDSGVPNTLSAGGCTISDLIAEIAAGAKNHGQFVSGVSHLTNDLKKDGVISGSQKGAIVSCAAGSSLP